MRELQGFVWGGIIGEQYNRTSYSPGGDAYAGPYSARRQCRRSAIAPNEQYHRRCRKLPRGSPGVLRMFRAAGAAFVNLHGNNTSSHAGGLRELPSNT